MRQAILDTLQRDALPAKAIAQAIGCTDMPTLYAELVSMEAAQLVTIEQRRWALKGLRHSEALKFAPDLWRLVPSMLLQMKDWEEQSATARVVRKSVFYRKLPNLRDLRSGRFVKREA